MIDRLVTTVEVDHPAEAGRIRLRGEGGPLSWGASLAPAHTSPGRHVFTFRLPHGAIAELKPIRDERAFARERNHTVLAGETLRIQPRFDHAEGALEPRVGRMRSESLGRDVRYRVWLPPSYEERRDRRYPVLYVQDGHAAFSATDGVDASQSWRLDETLNRLIDLDAVEETIVVGLHTDEGRVDLLSPSRDARHGGGDGERYLEFLAEELKPALDARLRTLPERESTAMMGSSMGGLFTFYAAWNRPDVFGKVACLSGSFWWDDRFIVREARGRCPFPRPLLYIDSGAAIDPFEDDANLRDGYHHTVALRDALVGHCYVAGSSLHLLTFPGAVHDGPSWAARLSIPLQLLFPRG
jgi:predicted alpha/beta superfamily hydrolase